MSYRAGYLPAERREIEEKLFSGNLVGVTATTALELGVDVGGLDATLHVGYPGSVASMWQQAGRAGRGGQPCLTVVIGMESGLDQYLHSAFYLSPSVFVPSFVATEKTVLVAAVASRWSLCCCSCRPHELPLEQVFHEAPRRVFCGQV